MISQDSLCLVASVSSTLCCIILKVPQIVTLAKSKSIRGLSISSVLLEFWMYSTMISYAYANNRIAIIQYCIALEHLPKTFVSAVVNLGIPIAVGSKLLQLGAIILSKDAGQVSGLTWKIAAYTSAARILTYTFEVWDLVLLLYHSLSFALNSAIAVAAIVYRKPVTKEG
ncbi:solute carrier family 66 member 3 isoform X3 [Tachypleus tridentatus]|uniref:solute carrier family 66 member 3 isoform X3 n=1 Tax=Tachypleus tridentatus TaxID=6853 RepID=UPI003FCFC326